MPAISPRARLHHAVRREFASTLSAYYRKYPEMLSDEMHEVNMRVTLALMQAVLEQIDLYEICDKEHPA